MNMIHFLIKFLSQLAIKFLSQLHIIKNNPLKTLENSLLSPTVCLTQTKILRLRTGEGSGLFSFGDSRPRVPGFQIVRGVH